MNKDRKLGEVETADRNVDISQRTVAIVAGTGLLVMFFAAIFANFFVIEGLIVPGDAETTANNIVANESLFRAGIASFLIVLICDVLVAWALYVFLNPVNKSLSLLAAWFRLVYTAIFGVALLNLVLILRLLSAEGLLEVFEPNQLHSEILLLLSAFNDGWLIGLVFFALHLFVIGYLVFKSGYIPGVLGVLLIVASFGYLTDSFAHFLLPNYADYEAIFLLIVAVPGTISELSLCLWLLFRGATIRQPDNRALASA